MRPDQLGDFRRTSDPRLHPDGRSVAFVVTQMDLETDAYHHAIWLWNGSQARPLTTGRHDTAPRWSPDGTRLAFLRKGPEDRDEAQVAVLSVATGATEVVTDFALGVKELSWSPDGTALGVAAVEWIPELADLDPDERARRPRRITELPYRADDVGWVHDRRTHLYVIDPSGARPPQVVTPGEFNETEHVWSPDGSTLAFVSARHAERGLDAGAQVWTVPADGGSATARTEVGWWHTPSFDRAGQLHALGMPDRWGYPQVQILHRLPASRAAEPLFVELDRDLVPASPTVAPVGPQWLDDGSAISLVEDEGRIRVVRLRPGGGWDDVIGGDRLVTGVSARPDGSAAAFVATAPTDPGELWWWEEGEIRPLTDLNADFKATTELAEPQRVIVESGEGRIEGWAYLPGGTERVPLLLNIHGGPATQYGYGFFDEFQVYAAAGYGVVAFNPRGSSGYGTAHMRGVVGRWADDDPPDLIDLAAGVEASLAQVSRLDPDRLGVMGGSYGGFATIRLLARDARFASAVAERGLYAWASFHGTSDIGPWFTRLYTGTDPVTDPDLVWRSSPIADAAAITTPTLVIHSESDFRAPVEQAEQLYAVLRGAGTTAELLRFPAGESHELSRSGSPRHRLERFEAILEWHDRHLR